MGRANVLQALGEGEYVIGIDYGTPELSARIDQINQEIASLEAQSLQAQAELAAIDGDAAAALAALDAAIAVLNAASGDDLEPAVDAVNRAAVDVAQATQRRGDVRSQIATFTLRIADLQGRAAQLASQGILEIKQTWCVDYTIEAEGEVSTIEINGEQPTILVAPGGDPTVIGDGEMRNPLAMSAAATYYNAAILPGWQKFEPTYRTGVLTAIDREANTGAVDLDTANSSAQNLPINQSSTLQDVVFEYLTCNNRAFSVGDEVVVMFEGQRWDQPKIIGFVSNPKACGPPRVIIPLIFNGEILREVTPPGGRPGGGDGGAMLLDLQWSEYVSGSILVPMPGDTPPPFWDAAIYPSLATTVLFGFSMDAAPAGLITSNAQFGGLGSFTFDEDYRLAGSYPTITTVVPPEFQTSRIFPRLGGAGFESEDFVFISFDEFSITGFEQQSRIYIDPVDTEENQAAITEIAAALSRYFSGIPSSITVTDPDGSNPIQYDFDRFYGGIESWPDYDNFPSTFGGLALGYRLPSG